MACRGLLVAVLGFLSLSAGVIAQPWQSSAWRTDWWRHSATLDMDFVGNRYMVSLTTPVVYTSLSQFIAAVSGTFSRNSIATYFDASGTLRTAPANTPRLEYDPSTSGPKGILIEEARTNVAPSDITASPWLSYSPGGTTNLISNSDVAPDGTLTAHRITCGDVSQCARYMGPAVTSGTTYTFSFFTKSAPGGVTCSRGRSGSATGSGFTYFSTNVGNGWIRHGFIETITSSGTWLPNIINYFINTPCIVWGPQIETGSFPTSYIPTSGTAVARAADYFQIPTSTGWFNANEGTFLADSFANFNSTLGQATVGRIIGADYPKVFIAMGASANLDRAGMYTGVTPLYSGNFIPAAAPDVSFRSASSFDASTSTQSITARGLTANGNAYTGSWSVNNIYIGSNGYITSSTTTLFDAINASVRRVTYFPIRQPDYSLPDYTR